MQPEEFMAEWESTKHQLRGTIFRITRNVDIVDDLMQDIFLNCYQRAGNLEQSYAAKYFMRAATNAALGYRGNGWVSKRLYDAPEPRSSVTPLGEYAIRERGELYKQEVLPALNALPPRQRNAIEAYMNFPTRKAAARAMGIPVATLWYNEKVALKNLKKRLEKYTA